MSTQTGSAGSLLEICQGRIFTYRMSLLIIYCEIKELEGFQFGIEKERAETAHIIEEKNRQLSDQYEQLVEQATLIQKYKEKYGDL